MRFSIKDWFAAAVLLSLCLMVWKTEMATVIKGLRAAANGLEEFEAKRVKMVQPPVPTQRVPAKPIKDEMDELIRAYRSRETVEDEMVDSFTEYDGSGYWWDHDARGNKIVPGSNNR